MKIQWKHLEKKWREKILADASGKVLEPGIGTGENFKYYPRGIELTGTDTSERMIDKARMEAMKYGIKTNFIVAGVNDLDFPAQSFDTIVSTFSMGEHLNPTELLNQYNSWVKPDGTVLLLEYGLSRCGVVRWFQKKWEPFQYRESGSHHNLDMIDIISGSRLRIKKVDIKYFGMVYMFWATLGPADKKSSYR